MKPTIAGVIPARYASTRFPGKALALLEETPLVVHVCRRAAAARLLDRVWVATDDDRIARAVEAAGFEARMTPRDCPSGSDRIAASLAPGETWDILVNIQGDEPRIEPSVIDAVARGLIDHPECGVSTAAVSLTRREDFESPHNVKVVLTPGGQALYFSRSPIPTTARLDPAAFTAPGFVWGLKHMGLYAYRQEVLEAYAAWPPTPLERRECLEQLRFLEHGVAIQVAIVAHDSIGVDTPEELEALILRERS
ncbi:MAG: 3-deoxy-manno-octulosonate cytidylyltransferase [bacterium]|nr:3-deoxy-manno-octulosonate cytidylyltransferase [bacterium]